MCRVYCEIEPGLISSEKVARLLTADGRHEEVVVSNKMIKGKTLCASEVGRDGNNVLVELPRESSSGKWRVWVKDTQIGG